ncbi:haloacid dehalogenase-like hydrolase [Cyanobium sp. ATX-6F1]|uniref:haloacid dehalogenase-like hydrolase n=1 Tax=Cyanobium sp. ATX-6F1 TaxID=3137388 RepID=UPI0039BDF287
MAAVSTQGSRDYVPAAERLAVFDNDGTLWGEQPMYVQLAFALDRARTLVAQRPELAANPVVAAAAAGDVKAVMAQGTQGLLELVALTHGGMSTETFARIVRDWFRSACHPGLHRPYSSLTFAPMGELLELLRSRGFLTVIVSGGGSDFLRVVTEELYGVPPEQVIGSTVRTTYAVEGACRCCCGTPRWPSSMTGPASRWASTPPWAGGRSPPSATPTVISRCSSGPPPARAPAWA